jgi:hypothetical protein
MDFLRVALKPKAFEDIIVLYNNLREIPDKAILIR